MKVLRIPVLLAALTLACSDSPGPEDDSELYGDYPLYEIGLSPLPAFDKPAPFRPQDSLMITGGTLRILSRGRVSVITNVEWWSDLEPGGIGFVAPETLTVSYTRTGDLLIVPFPNDPRGAHTDTIQIMNGFLRVARLQAHKEGTRVWRNFIYLMP